MFGLHCILSTEGDVKLFSFEPIPYLAAICEENIREYAKRGLTLGSSAKKQRDDSMVAVKIKCPLRTLSAVLDEEIPGTIDLLKIDVEKAEWDVLMGIRDDHWPLIRQVVMETHVVGDSVEMVVQLLQKKGFSKVVVGPRSVFKYLGYRELKMMSNPKQDDNVGITCNIFATRD
eukprot:Em0007g132a